VLQGFLTAIGSVSVQDTATVATCQMRRVGCGNPAALEPLILDAGLVSWYNASGEMGEPSLGGRSLSAAVCGLEELPDSLSRLWQAWDKVAPRNSKWGQAGENRVLTTTATESIPASARRALVRGEPVG
jgi:hypothetical protein